MKIWAIADLDWKSLSFLWVLLLLKWVGQLFSNIAGVRTRLTYITNPPHAATTTTLDHAFCVWTHVQLAAHFRDICGNFEPICATTASLFLPNESNENRFNKYTNLWWKTILKKKKMLLYNWCIWHRDWITLQLNDKTLSTEGQRWRCHAIEFHRELLWELACLDTSALVIVGRLRKKSLGLFKWLKKKL